MASWSGSESELSGASSLYVVQQGLGDVSGDLQRQPRDLHGMQLTCERALARMRHRGNEEARSARARERQLRKLLQQRTEQLDVLRIDLTTVVTRLEDSEEHSRGVHASLQEHRAEVSRLRTLLGERERLLAISDASARAVAVQLSTAHADLRSVRAENEAVRAHGEASQLRLHGILESSGGEARATLDIALEERDAATQELAQLRKQRRTTATRYLLLASVKRLEFGFGKWAFHARLISGATTDVDLAHLKKQAEEQAQAIAEAATTRAILEARHAELRLTVARLSGLSRLSGLPSPDPSSALASAAPHNLSADYLNRELKIGFGGDPSYLRLALLHWQRRTATASRALSGWETVVGRIRALGEGERAGRVQVRNERWARAMQRWLGREHGLVVSGENALFLILGHWRLLAQGSQLSAHCRALEAQRQNLTAAHTGAWWATGGGGDEY
mmetsp:Transcript_7722/g.20272  ORF Transcript_7722/g.20272 Transcript_7722/m.20272 type:complete len:449 (+) Transcript_7722:3-1349(+)